MVDGIGNNTVVSNVNAPARQNTQQSINFRAKSDFERTPQADSFEGAKKPKKKRTFLKLLGLAAAALGVVCFVKGKGPEGTTKTFIQRMKDGWQSIFSKKPIINNQTTPSAPAPASVPAPAPAPKPLKPNGEIVNQLLDENGKILSQNVKLADGSTEIYHYIYDKAGNLTDTRIIAPHFN